VHVLNTVSLSKIDLNLLVALQVLLEEQSVTLAAERLFITQPAMSRTLLRLRTLFDDPLFIRQGRGLLFTVRAEELRKALPLVLSGIGALVEKNQFDPKNFKGDVTVLMPEFIAAQLTSTLTKRLMAEAPHLSLVVTSEVDHLKKQYDETMVDFTIEVSGEYSDEYDVTKIGNFMPAIWMREKHPLSKIKKLSLRDMLEYPFVQYYLLLSAPLSANVKNRFDKELEKRGLKRHKILVTKQLMTAIDTLWNTDALMIATMHALPVGTAGYNIVRRPYPDDLDFDDKIPLVLVQHKRSRQSPMHQWFKNIVLEIAKDLRLSFS
jgi:DNA-binding transcriptional LysR family regulator